MNFVRRPLSVALALAFAAGGLAGCSAFVVEQPANVTVIVTKEGVRTEQATPAARPTAPSPAAGAGASVWPGAADLATEDEPGDADPAAERAMLRGALADAGMRGDRAAIAVLGERIRDSLRAPPAWAARVSAQRADAGIERADAAAANWQALRDAYLKAMQAGDAAGARDLADQALDAAEASFGANHPNTIRSLRDAADAAFATDDVQGAESQLALAHERAVATLGANHPDSIDILRTIGDLEDQTGNLQGALETYGQALAAAKAGPGERSAQALDIAMLLAQAQIRSGSFEEGSKALADTCAAIATEYGRLQEKTAECQTILGAVRAGAGAVESARVAFTEAKDILTSVHGPQHPATIRAEADVAEALRLAGRHADATTALRAVERRAEQLADAELLADVRSYLARALLDGGSYEEALTLNRRVHEARVKAYGATDPSALGALNYIAGTQMAMGDLAAAETSYREALAGYQAALGEEDAATITVLNNLGVVLEQQGLYDEAEPVLRQSMNQSESVLGPGHPTTLRNMNNLGLLYESQGNFEKAESLYAVPMEVLTRQLGREHPDAVAITNNLAFLYMLQQNYPRAQELFTRVVSGFEKSLGPNHQNTLKAVNNLGRTLLRAGNLTGAEPLIGRALAGRRTALGATHIDTLRSMLDLGALYFAQRKLPEAEKQLRETLALDERVLGEQHPYTFETLNTLAEVLQAAGKSDEALKLRQRGFDRRTAFLDRMLWVASENGREGYIRLHRDEFDQYLGAVARLPGPDAARALLGASLQRKGLLLRISSQIQQIANLGLDPELRDTARRLTDARKELAAKTLAGPQESTGDVHLRAVRDLERKVEELEGELGRASVLYREQTVSKSIDDVLAALPANASLVDYLVYTGADGTERLAVGIAAKRGADLQWRYLDLEYAAIAKGVTDYRAIIQDEGAADEDVLDTGKRLHALLWQPMADALVADAPVYLVPDGMLNILPFDALPDADGKYLLNAADIHLLTSSRDVLPTAVPDANSGNVLVLAGPDYDTEDAAGPQVLAAARSRAAERTRGASQLTPMPAAEEGGSGTRGGRGVQMEALRGFSSADLESRSAALMATLRAASSGMRGLRFQPLPGAEQEGRLIDEQVKKANLPQVLYTKIDAEEEVLAALDTPPRVLHIATHGFFLKPNDELRRRLLAMQRGADVTVPPPGDNPMLRAGLAFAGINSNAPYLGEIDTRNDGVLTALEVLGLNLAGTELAVLSACETGLGEIHYGEGVYGLRRAFQEAGVQEIVMSLWEVSDAGTQALMTEMYERLLAGATPREALRGAQRELATSPEWGYPYIWAAFTVAGR